MKTFPRFAPLAVLLFAFAIVPSLALAATDPVSILDNSYSPQNLTINPGDTVVWTNYGSLSHTVMADNGGFVSAAITPGVNFSYTFNSPGIYPYHDQSYGAAGGSGMSGTITVVGAQPQQTVTTGVAATTQTGTAASLQAMAQALLAKIASLQAQISAAGGTPVSTGAGTTINASSCPNIGRTLKLGSSGTDVSRLQVFLAQDPTVYPEGTVSGYYGALTQAAVQRWQAKYNIVSSGTPASTGWGVVGPRTATAIALLCSTGSTTGQSAQTTSTGPTVGGLLTVTPLSGAAPLTVNVQTTVNTVDSCVGATYVLNFGDGTQSTAIPTQSGNCLPQLQSFTHTYTAGGTYTVVLAAGTHQSSATVTVTGGSNSGIPADSMQASITSGPAPLTVVFTGTVSSSATLGCTGSCSDTINFGDGQIGLVQLPTTAGTWQSYVVDHTYAAAGSYTAQLESVTGAALGNAIAITATTPASQTGGSYGIVTITTTGSTLPVATSANIALPACGAYEINWGDSSALTTGTGGCVAGGTTTSVSHSYTAAGSYTVSLEDGNGNVKATSGVTIQ
jgi:plastocyanin